MAVAAKTVTVTERDETDPLDLSRDTKPAVVIDPEAAEILAANVSGGAAIGLFSYASFPVALDPSMPAIARLRQIATAGPTPTGESETLLFWRSGRLKRVKCTVTRYGGRGSKLLLLHIESAEVRQEAVPAVHLKSSPPSALKTSPGATDENVGSVTDANSDLRMAPNADNLAKLSHELKTPLTAIAAAAEIMRDERLGEMANKRYLTYAADIHESATHALDLISSLLADRGKPEPSAYRLVAIDLNSIVERTVSSVQALAQSCGLLLSFETEGRRPYIAANPTALRQVLLNLLTNAIKFTPQGGSVVVGTGYADDGRIVLFIRDTGCGMDGSRAPSLAAPSASDLKLQWARSHGIGLPLVETLVREMGAEIEFESSPQKGTTATIFFSDFAQRFK